MNTSTASASVIGNIPGDPDSSAVAFDLAGNLLVLDTYYERLVWVSPDTAGVLGSIALNSSLGPVAGMDADPRSGIVFVADGGTEGTDNLYTIDQYTGVLTLVGATGLPQGLSGLAFVPEPSTSVILGIGLGFVGRFCGARRHSRCARTRHVREQPSGKDAA